MKKNNYNNKQINFFDLGVTDFSHLKVTGVLNWHIYKDMASEDLLAFICKDVTTICRKFVSIDWQEEVNIVADYTIIDSYYHKHGNLKAKLTYLHFSGAKGKITKSVLQDKNL